ncbi:MAG: transcriptional regulator [Gemmatimonadota bacterium]|nr:transcriptional regulator [Gemmatimonadota bacterium]MDE2983545.1 transcriptional regulator [Gemmatimonadota bacterium]
MSHRTFLRRHPVFTGAELTAHLASRGELRPRTKESLLAYYTGTGRVLRIRRGLYAVIPPGSDRDSYPVDPFLIASRLTGDAVLSHHTALEYHGRAYSVWQHLIYSAARPLKTLEFRAQTYRGTRFPESLRRAGQEHFGVLESEQSGVALKVTSLERTLVDVMHRPFLGGGWEEIWRSLESVEFFNVESVVAYTLLLGNATTCAKVGFFLEQHRDALMIDGCDLQQLRDRRPAQPHYMDRGARGTGRLLPAWNLVVPEELAEKSWEGSM